LTIDGRASDSPPPLDVHALILSQSYAGNPSIALPNTARDARLIADSFRRLGFQRTTIIGDGPTQDILSNVNTFLGQLDQQKIAVFYLAGHGIELAGENLFMLSDGASYISLQALVQTLQECAGVTVLFLDACRNNPAAIGGSEARLARAVPVRQADAARAQLDIVPVQFVRAAEAQVRPGLRAFALPGSGVKIVFSTDPGNVAFDGATVTSRNSPFAKALARRLRDRVSIDDVVSLTTGDVLAATGRRQAPWSQGSLDRPIYLSRASTRPARARAPTGSNIPRG
jgi:uncharacterized caspase-like protein